MRKNLGLRAAESVMGMNPAVWARHANPWSGWTRVAILPLLAAAVWSRIWIGWWALAPLAMVLFWTWLNPRVFPPPASTDNWMSRGVLGERIWLRHGTDPALAHHVPVIRAVMAAGLAGTALLIGGLTVLNPVLAAVGLAIAMLSKLWFLDRMVWVHREAGDLLPRRP